MQKHIIRVVAALAGVAVASLGLSGCAPSYEGTATDCTVTEKYVAIVSKSAQKRIVTSCGIFTVDDEPMHSQWNSADLYAQIEIGVTYDFEAYGYRNGFWSMFPNVAAVTTPR